MELSNGNLESKMETAGRQNFSDQNELQARVREPLLAFEE